MNNNDKVIVDFAAESWCLPCQKLKPHYEKASTLDDDTIWLHADIDLNPALVDDYVIMGVPTLKAYKSGEYVGEVDRKLHNYVALSKYSKEL